MNDEQLHHGMNWDGRDLTGWAISEKFDGCRAWWDGAKMWTRGGREIVLPDWFRAQLPAGFELDGEMWAGRGRFSAASVAVRLGRITPDIKFMVFDTPMAAPWLDRLALAALMVGEKANVSAAPALVARSTEHALELCETALEVGGEGIMARSPGDECTAGRADTLLKLKSTRGWGVHTAAKRLQ